MTDLEKAAELGRRAFERGANSVPAHDPELTELIKGKGISKATITLLESWSDAWHKANIEAPIEDWWPPK